MLVYELNYNNKRKKTDRVGGVSDSFDPETRRRLHAMLDEWMDHSLGTGKFKVGEFNSPRGYERGRRTDL